MIALLAARSKPTPPAPTTVAATNTTLTGTVVERLDGPPSSLIGGFLQGEARRLRELLAGGGPCVRERLKELVEANREGRNQALMDSLERELMAAERLKDLTVVALQHADENWREWKEEVARRRDGERWHHDSEQLTRQEKATTSATWAAWGAFLAALASAAVAAWQVFGPARHP